MSSVLAQTVGQSYQLLDAFILRSDVNPYARQQAIIAYAQLVHAGRISREFAIDRLREFLRFATRRQDDEFVTEVVRGLKMLAPREAAEEIQAAHQAF